MTEHSSLERKLQGLIADVEGVRSRLETLTEALERSTWLEIAPMLLPARLASFDMQGQLTRALLTLQLETNHETFRSRHPGAET